MATVKFENVNKVYDNKVQAVYDFNLEIADKEFVVFVGPSGCGKSTTLRMLAGFEEITSGEISINGTVVNDKTPRDRDIAMVFQNYALYPHMTVFKNLAFPLKMRKYSKEETKERVEQVARILNLTEYLKRKPKALSGGQKQRVALGRAIVREPQVFLMDEPLSNLDAKLRVQMREEIVRIHKEVGATTIYVTHDQVEAITMADRIVCMRDGRVQQIGTPKEIYANPANRFVASFIGSPAMNFIEGRYHDGKFSFKNTEKEISLKVKEEMKDSLAAYEGKSLLLGVRPEYISISRKQIEDSFPIDFTRFELLGSEIVVYGKVLGQNLTTKVFTDDETIPFADCFYKINMDKALFFDIDTEMRIYESK